MADEFFKPLSQGGSDSFFKPLKQETPPSGGLGLPRIGIGKKVAEDSQLPEMQRTLGRTGKVVGSAVAGLPGDIVSQLAQGINFVAQNVPGGKPKTEEELREITESPFTSQSISRGIEKRFPSLEPKTEKESEWEENLGLLTSLATPLPLGKSKAFDPRTTSKIYKAGRSLGLSPKEMTILLHGDAKQNILGKLTRKTTGLKKALELTENKLGDVRSKLGEKASSLPQISEEISEKLTDQFAKIRTSLGKTVKGSPDKEAAAKFIEDSIERINNFGANPEELMNFYHDINAAVNWRAIKGGKKVLSTLKEPVLEALEKASPKIGKDFRKFNLLYSKMKDFEKAVGYPKIAEFINHGKAAEFLTYAALGSLGGIKMLAGTEAARQISTKLLTDPKWQNLHNKILNSIKNGSFNAMPKLVQILKNMTKQELPDEYKEIDWTSLQENNKLK
jgi:hypothetical protein